MKQDFDLLMEHSQEMNNHIDIKKYWEFIS